MNNPVNCIFQGEWASHSGGLGLILGYGGLRVGNEKASRRSVKLPHNTQIFFFSDVNPLTRKFSMIDAQL